MDYNTIDKILDSFRKRPKRTILIICIIALTASSTVFLKSFLEEWGKKIVSGNGAGGKNGTGISESFSMRTFSPTDYVAKLTYHPPDSGESQRVEMTEFEPRKDLPSTITQSSEHLRLVEVSSDPTTDIFKITVQIKNEFNEPMSFDLKGQNFRLENDHGQDAELVHAILPKKGAVLRKSERRYCELYFRGMGWHGKGKGPKYVHFHIEGLGTVERATWKWPLFITLD